MPELRGIRPRDAIAALERAGGVVRSGKGGHVNIKMLDGQVITFSGRREPITIGLLKATLRTAELSEDDFLRLPIGERKWITSSSSIPRRRAASGRTFPSLDGCFAQGDTIEDVLAELRDAMTSHLDALRAEGRPILPGRDVLIATMRIVEPRAASFEVRSER